MKSIYFAAILALVISLQSSVAQDDEGLNCPFGCPEGWTRFGFSEHCYKLPAQPAKLDTFWNHDARCKEMEPTSYIMVINGLTEQAAATVIAFQYAINWFAVLLNGFIWLGGHTTPKGWKFLDGTDQSGSVLMLGAGLIGSQNNNTCLGADPKTLGLWQTRPCDDKTGAAICEMPMRRVCGKRGGILPISPISFSICSLTNLFPKLPSIPFIGTVLGGSALDNALSFVGSKLNSWLGGDNDPACKAPSGTTPKPECPYGCPAGWVYYSASPNDRCYQDIVTTDTTFWNMQQKCRQLHPNANIMLPNTLLEFSTQTGSFRQLLINNAQWIAPTTVWLGAYSTDSEWRFLDRSSGSFLSAIAHLRNSVKNFTCLVADFPDLGNWRAEPCSFPRRAAICEMPKISACSGLDGRFVNVVPEELSRQRLKFLFPDMPDNLPGIEQALGLQSSMIGFRPQDAAKNNKTDVKAGDAITSVTCVSRPETGFFSSGKPRWDWLRIGGDDVTVPGRWVESRCGNTTVTAFEIQASTYLSLWSRCYNRGHETAMPADSSFSGYYPFKVGDHLAEYYRESTGLWGFVTTGFTKMPVTSCVRR